MGMGKRDLITKDFALYVVHYFNAMQTWSKKDILAEIDRTIKEVKPEDAVRVVRCKDCKHREHNDALLYCGHTRGLAGSVSPDDFCSYGERRTDERQAD